MTRFGFLSRLLLVVVVGCNGILFSPAQSPNVSDLDRMVNQVPPSTRWSESPVYANAQGKVKGISKKKITIVQPGGQELTFRLTHAVRTQATAPVYELKEIKLANIDVGDNVLIRFKKYSGPHKALGILVLK
jgi:hypothetical protein